MITFKTFLFFHNDLFITFLFWFFLFCNNCTFKSLSFHPWYCYLKQTTSLPSVLVVSCKRRGKNVLFCWGTWIKTKEITSDIHLVGCWHPLRIGHSEKHALHRCADSWMRGGHQKERFTLFPKLFPSARGPVWDQSQFEISTAYFMGTSSSSSWQKSISFWWYVGILIWPETSKGGPC